MPLRHILLKESANENVSYLTAPSPDISEGSDKKIGPFLEGGDVLVNGKTIFVGYSGLASNKLGIDWLGNLLSKWGYRVIAVRLHPDVLHLDCALSLLREGLMICCEEAFLDGLPAELKSWERISINLNEAAQMMANGLPINDEVYITDCAFTELIAKIESYGIKVEGLEYSISRLFGGSFRCTTQALLRE